jgi:hypothetical protein
MCIIIDTNRFSSIFEEENSDHDEFKPILDWIIFGKGKIVYGGTKYKQELTRAANIEECSLSSSVLAKR